jgi:hypothetical protein
VRLVAVHPLENRFEGRAIPVRVDLRDAQQRPHAGVLPRRFDELRPRDHPVAVLVQAGEQLAHGALVDRERGDCPRLGLARPRRPAGRRRRVVERVAVVEIRAIPPCQLL